MGRRTHIRIIAVAFATLTASATLAGATTLPRDNEGQEPVAQQAPVAGDTATAEDGTSAVVDTSSDICVVVTSNKDPGWVFTPETTDDEVRGLTYTPIPGAVLDEPSGIEMGGVCGPPTAIDEYMEIDPMIPAGCTGWVWVAHLNVWSAWLIWQCKTVNVALVSDIYKKTHPNVALITGGTAQAFAGANCGNAGIPPAGASISGCVWVSHW